LSGVCVCLCFVPLKAPNPFNPLSWIRTTQDFFLKSERSSGFRPYLIFLIILCGLDLTLLVIFRENLFVQDLAKTTLYIGVIGFVVLFGIKAFQDPNFCRSEKHVETVKRIELTESKGDPHPIAIDVSAPRTIPKPPSLEITEGGQQ
jgi:hypothetical protein